MWSIWQYRSKWYIIKLYTGMKQHLFIISRKFK